MDRIYQTKALSAEPKPNQAALDRLQLLLSHHWDELVRAHGVFARYEHLSHSVAVTTSPAGGGKVAGGWSHFHAIAVVHYSYDPRDAAAASAVAARQARASWTEEEVWEAAAARGIVLDTPIPAQEVDR